jgi:hypothetical protein
MEFLSLGMAFRLAPVSQINYIISAKTVIVHMSVNHNYWHSPQFELG